MALQSGARSEERESEAAFRHGGWRNRRNGVADPGGKSRPLGVASVSLSPIVETVGEVVASRDNYGRAP